MSPPIARPFPRFIADPAREPRPYGRWAERLAESFAAACAEHFEEAGTGIDVESIRWFPERTWGERTFIPAVAHGESEVDGVRPEFYGHVSFRRPEGEDGEAGELEARADFTDVIAADNPDWQVDLNDDVIGEWRADGGRGGDVTLIWGTPLVRGALAATAELGSEILDQGALHEGRFSLLAVDAVHGFGDEDLFLEVKLWDRRLREIASESLYADEDGEPGEEGSTPGGDAA